MSDALRFEWVRLRTLRSTYWLIASALVLNGMVGFLFALYTRDEPTGVWIVNQVATGGGAALPLPLVGLFMAILGIFASGHDYRYGTIHPALTTVPQRTRLLAAKVVVVAVAALVVAVVSLVVNLAAGMIFWDGLPDLFASPVDQMLPGFVLLVVLWAAVGVALGQLFRGVPAPLVVVLVMPLIVEQLVLRLSFTAVPWFQPLVKFLPFTAGQQLVGVGGEASGGDATELDMLARWPSAAVFIAFVAAALAAALILFKRRDA